MGIVPTLQDGFKKEVRAFHGVGYRTYSKHFVHCCHYCIALLGKTFNGFTFVWRHSIVIFTARPLSPLPVSILGPYAAAALDNQADLPRSVGVPGSFRYVLFPFSFPEEIRIIYQVPDPVRLLDEVSSASSLPSLCPDASAQTLTIIPLRNSLSPWAFLFDCQKWGFSFWATILIFLNAIHIKYMLENSKFLLA